MQASKAAFLSYPSLPFRSRALQTHPSRSPACPLPIRHAIICVKKGAKKRANKPNPSRKASKKSPKSPPVSRNAPSADSSAESAATFPGPVAPEEPTIANSAFSTDDMITAETLDESEDAFQSPDEIPLADESKLKLPENPNKGPKRKKKPRTGSVEAAKAAKAAVSAPEGIPEVGSIDEAAGKYSADAIRELTTAYRTGGDDAQRLIDEIEKDPDFMFRTENPEGEYDITSAIIGTGRPNKQGVYVLPYLQSGHILLLLVILLATFVYYPGFPLTELDETVRVSLKRGLLLTYGLNGVLSVLAFRDAKKRGQPAAFWSIKTAVLGNLAFNELRRNAGTQKAEE